MHRRFYVREIACGIVNDQCPKRAGIVVPSGLLNKIQCHINHNHIVIALQSFAPVFL